MNPGREFNQIENLWETRYKPNIKLEVLTNEIGRGSFSGYGQRASVRRTWV